MKKLLITFMVLYLTAPVFGQVKPMLGTQIDHTHISGDPDAAWFFLEGSGRQVFDLSGNGNHATGLDLSQITWVAGPDGSAIDFLGNGRQQVFQLQKLITLLSTDEWTLTFKVQTDGDLNEGVFIGEYLTTDDRISLVEGTKFRFDNSSGTQTAFASVTSFTAWSTYSLVADGVGNLSLYVDGVWKETQGGEVTSFKLDAIGNAYPSDTYPLDGRCSFLFLHRRALSASEIALLYREPFGMFETDEVALMIVEAAPAPTGGQVIMITSILFLGLCIWKYKAA